MPADALPRRLFLAATPVAGRASIAEHELHHARDVLRLAPGDRLVGLDGRGGRWPVVVQSVQRGAIAVAVEGEVARDPEPGSADSGEPWIEVAASLPRPGRAEAMVERLTQLGVSLVRPVAFERTPPHARSLAGGRLRRLERVAREACKQAVRSWVPRIEAARPVAELWKEDLPTVVLDQAASVPLAAWLAARGGPAPGRVRIVVGPEGGLTSAEAEAARAAGAEAVWLARRVLRVETAAELAVGLTAHAAGPARDARASRPSAGRR